MTVKIGMVGCGYMGQLAHLDNLAQIDGCEVVALAEPRKQLREKVAAKYGIERQYDDHKPIAEDPTIQGVAAIMHYAVQVEPVCELLRAGKWVLIEKPMASCLAESQKLVDAVKEGGAQLMVGFMKRYDPGVRRAQETAARWFETGEAGALTSARAVVGGGDWICGADGSWIRTDEPAKTIPFEQWSSPDWVPDTEEGKNDLFWLFDVCVHNVNLLRFLLGTELTTKSVLMLGLGNTALFESRGAPVTMTWGSMECDWWYEETELLFEKGYIKLLTPPPLLRRVPTRVEIYHKKDEHGTVFQPQFPWQWSFKEEARHFVECVRDKKVPLTNGEDSLHDVAVLEEILKMKYCGS